MLIRAKEPSTGREALLVRGLVGFPYHADIFGHTVELLPALRLHPLGGGRIRRTATAVHVYGYSQAFGRADHAVAVEIIRRALPSLPPAAVTWSNEGY